MPRSTAILSADYFTVDDSEIPGIESELTVAGGRIVYASDAYQGQDEELPAITMAWSPVARFGGYQQASSGVLQGQALTDAAADSAAQAAWRRDRGERVAKRDTGPDES
jgi:hypothetical protein